MGWNRILHLRILPGNCTFGNKPHPLKLSHYKRVTMHTFPDQIHFRIFISRDRQQLQLLLVSDVIEYKIMQIQTEV